MRISNRVKKIYKTFQIPAAILVGVVVLTQGILDISVTIKSYINMYKEDNKPLNIKIVQIKRGETKLILENELLQITVDNILKFDETGLYSITGKLDNGYFTNIFLKRTQGESIQFDKYIIQIIRIASDYADFRVSSIGNH